MSIGCCCVEGYCTFLRRMILIVFLLERLELMLFLDSSPLMLLLRVVLLNRSCFIFFGLWVLLNSLFFVMAFLLMFFISVPALFISLSKYIRFSNDFEVPSKFYKLEYISWFLDWSACFLCRTFRFFLSLLFVISTDWLKFILSRDSRVYFLFWLNYSASSYSTFIYFSIFCLSVVNVWFCFASF